MQEAAWVGGDYRLGAGGKQLFYFAIAKLTGWFGIEKIVDTGGTAAQVGLLDLDNLEPGNGGE